MYNILDGHSEADRVIYSDSSPTDGFVIVPDLKWDGKDLHNIYLVAIVRRRDIFSLRDISTDHLSMLKGILCTGKVDSTVHVHNDVHVLCIYSISPHDLAHELVGGKVYSSEYIIIVNNEVI